MNNQSNNQYRKLDGVSTQYRTFSKGQYIEHTQFNEFLDFFEDQDRLSRVMLQGVGIICGLKPSLLYKNGLLNAMQLSQGAAITTDGDLLTLNEAGKAGEDLYVSELKTVDLQNKDYTHFKKYDNFKAQYPAFKKEDGSQIELWELIPAQEAGSGARPITDLPDPADKYLLLYLESYEKDIKPCRGVDCDNHGSQQIRNLKVLAATREGIAQILEKDAIQPHALFVKDILEAEKPERVIIERLLLEQGDEAQFDTPDLKGLYIRALENSAYGASVFKKINAISRFMGLPAVDHEKFTYLLKQFLQQDTGFQYAYDVLKDLTDTYSEIIRVLPKSFTIGFPDLESFPKHVMLGKLGSDFRLDKYRHRFYHSPVLDDEKETLQVKVLLARFAQQVQNFKYAELQKGGGITITPSQKSGPLGCKAVPFYYQVTQDLLKAWNFDKTAHRSSGENLAYDLSLLSSAGPIQNPLDFNIDKNTFYNIEGHQGMSRDEAYGQLKELRDTQQLGFDIMLLSFGELTDNKDLFKAYFNEYVGKHPGLEHKRGVERGGTFVMIYEHNGRESSIVADFSIPYICCTPKINTDLSLPASVICAGAEPIPFTVLPVGGVVKALVDSADSGVVLTEDNKYFFDPEKLDESLWGQVITFTVNGKPTGCTIKVIAQPDIDVKVDYVFYPERNSEATTVVMLVSGENFKEYTYYWDFLDNGSFVTVNPDENGRLKYTLYDVNPARIPTIKVKIEGSGCTQEVWVRDWYKEPTQLSLPVSEICSDADAVSFTVSPAGGVVEASSGGGVKFKNGKYTFDPKLIDKSLHGQLITFTVNGQSTNCSIKVLAQPEITIEVEKVDYPANGSSSTTVHFFVSGYGFEKYSYRWDFLENGNFTAMQPDGDGNLIYTFTNLDRSKIPVIKVKVSNGSCTEEISIDNTWYNEPVKLSLPVAEICSDSKAIPFTVSPAGGTVKASAGGGVKFENGKYTFDPALVDKNLHGQLITFTVNGQPTNCSIKVMTKPQVKIDVTEVDYPANGSSSTTVHFFVSEPGFENYSYSWDFGDYGNQFFPNLNSGGNVIHTFTNLDKSKIPVIKVKVSNGNCIQEIIIGNTWYNPPAEDTNRAPVAVASASYTTIQLPTNSTELKGSSSYDADGTIVSYVWTQIGSTPAIANIGNPNTADTVVTGLVEGNYTFQLAIKDNKGASASDEVVITVNRAVDRTPTLKQIENISSGFTRKQTFEVGKYVSEGNKFRISVYNVVLVLSASASDTSDTIAEKMAYLIKHTTEQEWNASGNAPAGSEGFPPTAVASGEKVIIELNLKNECIGNASVN